VATDVAARGIDVPDVQYVVHWEVPVGSDVFVHRSGRAGEHYFPECCARNALPTHVCHAFIVGRAGTSGTNVVLCDDRGDQLNQLQKILRTVGIAQKVHFPALPRPTAADIIDDRVQTVLPRRMRRVYQRAAKTQAIYKRGYC